MHATFSFLVYHLPGIFEMIICLVYIFTRNSLLSTVILQIENNKSELIIISSLLSVFLLLLT